MKLLPVDRQFLPYLIHFIKKERLPITQVIRHLPDRCEIYDLDNWKDATPRVYSKQFLEELHIDY